MVSRIAPNETGHMSTAQLAISHEPNQGTLDQIIIPQEELPVWDTSR